MTTNTVQSDEKNRLLTAKPLTVRAKAYLPTPDTELAPVSDAESLCDAAPKKAAASDFAAAQRASAPKYVISQAPAKPQNRDVGRHFAVFSAKMRALWARIYFKTLF